MKRLSVKQKKFADEYIKTGNSYQSALKAGYSETIAKGQSYKFIENVGIQEYIHAKTDKIIKKEADETDAVLRNIYRIASGKRIRRRFTKIDNLQKEITMRGVTKYKPTAEMRKEYEEDEVTSTPAPVKEQVAAAEIWLKYRGMLSSDSKPIENAKIRKAEVETKIAEAKLKLLSSDNDGQMTALTNLMNILQGDNKNADK